MILKKQEKDNKIKAMYNSSTILASIYNKDTNDLTVIFKNGGQYKYSKVGQTDYTRFELADSQGQVLNSHIKKYAFEKLDSVDPTAIIKEIDEMKAAEEKSSLDVKTKEMLTHMSALITGYLITGKISSDSIKKIETSISDYNKVANPQPQVVV